MELNYSTVEKVKSKMLDISDKEKYDIKISEKSKEMLCMFDCLNPKKTTEQNIENFFEVLVELIEFEKGGAKA